MKLGFITVKSVGERQDRGKLLYLANPERLTYPQPKWLNIQSELPHNLLKINGRA